MSDAAIANIVTGIVTIVTLVIGFLTLWVKLKYGAEKAEEAAVKADIVESKIDANTKISAAAAASAQKAEHQTNGVMTALKAQITDHNSRIIALEAQMAALKVSVDSVKSNIDSTRHEMRGHFQTMTNKLDLITTVKKLPTDPA